MYDTVEPVHMKEKPFSQLKGDERDWRINDAVNVLKQYTKIKKDKNLMAAAREELKKEVSQSQAVLKGLGK
jgi:hypothetical protein